MAGRPPQNTDPGLDPDLEQMSEAEQLREAKRRARIQKKRQKAELARIQKEMEGPRSKWVYIGALILALLVAALGYGAWCFRASYTVNLARKAFMDDYSVADLPNLRRYAPDVLGEVEDLKQEAEQGAETLSTSELVEKYRKASVTLQDARQAARDNRADYESTLEDFEKFYQEAKEKKLDKYATSLWSSVEQAKTVATEDSASDFSFTLALSKLREGIEILQEAQDSYAALEVFDQAFSSFEALHAEVREEEWSQNLPDGLNSLRGILNNAEAARQAGQWEKAATLYTESKQIIAPQLQKLKELRGQAEEHLKQVNETTTEARKAGIAARAKEDWARIQKLEEECKAAFAAYDYSRVAELAKQTITLLEQTRNQINEAKGNLLKHLSELKAIREEAVAFEKFFRATNRQEWLALEEAYDALQGLIRGGDDIVVLKEALRLKSAYKALIDARATLMSGLGEIKKRLAAIETAPMAKFVAINYPAADRRIFSLRRAVERHEKRGDIAKASAEYHELVELLESKTAALVAASAKIAASRETCAKRIVQFRRGMEAFGSAKLRKAEQLERQVDRLTKENRWVEALPLQEETEKLIPGRRFTPGTPGTVIDNVEGVMWVADGTSPGCNGGKKLDWHKAFAWVSALDFGGFTDWRLPTEEELRVLARLDPALLREVLPGTAEGAYWTGVPAADFTKVLTFNFALRKVERASKNTPHYVRPIRVPE